MDAEQIIYVGSTVYSSNNANGDAHGRLINFAFQNTASTFDLNGDGIISFQDYTILVGQSGRSGSGDFNQSGT